MMAGLEGRIFDHYELRSLLGRGGMADVYLGYDPRFERDIAVKVFKRGEDEDLLRRFIREARMMGSLQNSHLIPVYDTGMINLDGYSQYYIVMPYMSGGTLRDRIRGKPLSLAETSRCLSDIADALDYIHSQGIIHRDIKSSNVLLDADGRCYIADFGIARTSTQATQMTSTGSVLGTVDYIAPELFDGTNQKADVRSDLYSLGVLLFEMVTGQMPFKAENPLAVVTMHMTKQPPSPRSFVPTLPPQVEAVIMKGLEKNPAFRFGSAGEMARAFSQAVAGRNPSGEYNTSSTVWNNNVADASTVQARPGPPLVLPPSSNGQRPPSYPQATGTYGSNTAYRGQTPQPTSYPRQSSYIPQTGGYRTQSTYPYQPEPEPPRKRGSIVVLLALITMLAVLAPVLYVFLTHQHNLANQGATPPVTGTNTAATPTVAATATPDTTATAQAMATTAAAQQANATSTALAGTTATAQAQAAATPGVLQTATAAQPAYQDALNSAHNNTTQNEQWDESGHCKFEGDGYHVLSNTTLNQNGGCRESGTTYTNATIAVDVAINSGQSGGLFFYVNTQALGAYAGYLFEIDTQGNYQIIRSSNFSLGGSNVTLQSSTASALKTGPGATNRLQVIARNGTLLFYINGTFVNQQSDSTFTSGQIAFLSTPGQDGQQADVVYSNLSVYQ